jgi:3-mercaptopyruvate sulfurtransferase SseA
MAGLALTIAGCGKNPSSYTDPYASVTTTKTPNALIDAATLKGWMDEGKVNSTNLKSRDRVVIVTVTTPAAYATGHIPGSPLWNSNTDLTPGRLEGVAALTSEVPTGPAMDALIQRLGIDQNTTVVFTGSRGSNVLNMTRAYFTFRYWGFPKNRLKVLQGGDSLWVSAGNTLTTATPSIRSSAMSVRDNYAGSLASFSMRTAIGDMINVVDGINLGTINATSPTGIRILDTRGGVDPLVGPYIANSKVDDYGQYLTTPNAAFKPLGDMTARLATFGVTASTSMTYVSCASGHRASSLFFVLDGMLGWPVTLYDGSSGQWLALPRTFGTVPTTTTLTLDPLSNTIYTSITDPRANQIGVEDKLYMTTGQTGGSSGGGNNGGDGTPSGC